MKDQRRRGAQLAVAKLLPGVPRVPRPLDGDSAGHHPMHGPLPPSPRTPPLKSRGGWQRVVSATRYSLAGLRAAVRHEAAFRQELAVGLPLVVLAPFIAPGRWQALLMIGSVLAVWIVELLNSAIEALADAQSTEMHPLLGRAKDLGSAAVMLSLCSAGAVWLVALWP